ncbi:DUF4179 domain-containing protein [Clostridium sp. MSJ-11]|uniref:DUF4179 domain-containing protein n=1 Tax=Clostridium mobile TaxID=2841512 RepID=A0ABS6EM09_9CLOT|nr:DUF4179 domain-containing protein [Clostridium mobile]MBU5486259.1 DUF4179 domain-containing protein [Clostridium mobile]
MKDIYEHFNEISLDLDLIEKEDINVDDITIGRIKNKFKNSINKKNNRKIKVLVASLALTMGICAVTLNNSVLADKLPNINIGTFFSNFNYNGKFQDYAEVIGETKSDKGYEVTLDEIVMDDYSLMIIYTIKAEEKVEELINEEGAVSIYAPDKSIKINNKEIRGAAGGNYRIINDNTVQVMMDYDVEKNDIPNNFSMDISFNKINNISGDWRFKFNASKNKIEDTIKTYDINEKYTFEDDTGEEIELIVDKITFSSISTVITFKTDKEFEYYYIDFIGEEKINHRGSSLSRKELRLGHKYEAIFKLDYVEEIPEKISIEYNKKDGYKTKVAEINLKE